MRLLMPPQRTTPALPKTGEESRTIYINAFPLFSRFELGGLMAGTGDFMLRLREALEKVYPESDGWSIQTAEEGDPQLPNFIVSRGRHVVAVDGKDAGEITERDVERIDGIRDLFLGISAVIYTSALTSVPPSSLRLAQRLGVRIIKLT